MIIHRTTIHIIILSSGRLKRYTLTHHLSHTNSSQHQSHETFVNKEVKHRGDIIEGSQPSQYIYSHDPNTGLVVVFGP